MFYKSHGGTITAGMEALANTLSSSSIRANQLTSKVFSPLGNVILTLFGEIGVDLEINEDVAFCDNL